MLSGNLGSHLALEFTDPLCLVQVLTPFILIEYPKGLVFCGDNMVYEIVEALFQKTFFKNKYSLGG